MRNLIAVVISIVITSCAGVGYSFRGGTIKGETFTVEAVKLGPTLTLVNPNLPITMQDALIQRFTNESNLKYAATGGDASFDATIKSYTITPVQGTGETVVSLNRLTISMNVLYKNPKDETIPAEGKTLKASSYADFESTEDFSTKETELVETITENLVALIYNQVLVDW